MLVPTIPDIVVVCLPDDPELVHMGELPANVDVRLVPPEPAPVPDLAEVDLIVPCDRTPRRAARAARRGRGSAARHPDAERRRRLAHRSGARARHRSATPAGSTTPRSRSGWSAPSWRCSAASCSRATRRRDASGTSIEPPELLGRRVVILGLGSIGTAISDRLRPFGVEVIGVGRTARDGVRGLADLDEVLRDAEILVNILPLTGETRGLLDARRLSLLPDGALVVNAGRGRTIDDRRARRGAPGRSDPGRPRRHRSGAAPAGSSPLGAAQRPRSPRTWPATPRRARSEPSSLPATRSAGSRPASR